MTAYVYRAFDDDQLLYVGCTVNVRERIHQHRHRGAEWIDSFDRLTVEEYPTRDHALAAERIAIRTENPRFNVRHREVLVKAAPGRSLFMLPEGLRAWRKVRGLTQVELAERVGCSETLIALIETGRRQPGIDNARSIAAALDVDLEALALLATPGEDAS